MWSGASRNCARAKPAQWTAVIARAAGANGGQSGKTASIVFSNPLSSSLPIAVLCRR
jgi:hypothetical protein